MSPSSSPQGHDVRPETGWLAALMTVGMSTERLLICALLHLAIVVDWLLR